MLKTDELESCSFSITLISINYSLHSSLNTPNFQKLRDIPRSSAMVRHGPPCCRKCSPSLGMGPRSSVISVIRVCGWRSGDPRRSNHVFGAIKYGQTVSNPINILSKYVEMLLELYYSNTIKPKDSIHHDSL